MAVVVIAKVGVLKMVGVVNQLFNSFADAHELECLLGVDAGSSLKITLKRAGAHLILVSQRFNRSLEL